MKKMSKALRALMTEAKEDVSFWVEQTKLAFALALEDRLRAAGMTYKAFADKLGTTAAYVSKIFRGDSNMTIESMVKLARASGGHLVVSVAGSEAEAEAWSSMRPINSRIFNPHSGRPYSGVPTRASYTEVAADNDERFCVAA